MLPCLTLTLNSFIFSSVIPTLKIRIFPGNIYYNKLITDHPKTVAFISHGGLLGTTEAIHCGVPMLFIPVFADQGTNSAAAVEAGLGKRVLYGAITKESVYEALSQVLTPE